MTDNTEKTTRLGPLRPVHLHLLAQAEEKARPLLARAQAVGQEAARVVGLDLDPGLLPNASLRPVRDGDHHYLEVSTPEVNS